MKGNKFAGLIWVFLVILGFGLTGGLTMCTQVKESSIPEGEQGSFVMTPRSLGVLGVVQEWAAYTGAGSKNVIMALDENGNVYVAGSSKRNDTDEDYFLVSYSANGTRRWEKYYDSDPETIDVDEARAIAIDNDRNRVFVTGRSNPGLSGHTTCTTVAYSLDQGEEKWVENYPAGPKGHNAVGNAITVDEATGNVYVAGLYMGSTLVLAYHAVEDPENGPDIITQLWNQTPLALNYKHDGDEPCAIAVDAAGNIYVTGTFDDDGSLGNDYFTFSLDAGGNLRKINLLDNWVLFYQGTYINNMALGMTVDASGNVYVTGLSDGAIDGINRNECATIKYNALGVLAWDAHYSSTPDTKQVATTAIALDPSGNVCVTGFTFGNSGSESDYDYITIKYDNADGHMVWQSHYNGPNDSSDYVQQNSIVIDAGGGIYVTGTSITQSGYEFFWTYDTVAYDANGNQMWVARCDRPDTGLNSEDHGRPAIAVDVVSNAVYIAGTKYLNDGYTYQTIKYVQVEIPPEQQIINILNFIDDSVAEGNLAGIGPGNSAANRLNALKNMISAARNFIVQDRIADACRQLLDAYKKTDGNPSPPDFVTGDAAAVLAAMIESVREELGCE
jgi:hypothetical protein